jgi:predicted TIM-barrel fold metal-dependent hydrolase
MPNLRIARVAAAFGLAWIATAALAAPYTMADFTHVRKFDAHVHDNVADDTLLAVARADNFEMLSINVDYPDFPSLQVQQDVAHQLQARDPRRFHFATTFSMQGFGQPGWAEAVNQHIAAEKANGALAVKVWKNIGMVAVDAQGKRIYLDNPGFDPVIAKVIALNLPLIAHQGEPKDCWLPLDQMMTEGDREYFTAHPNYYAYRHPELASYETLMAARDRFVARHPDLSFVGAHMASLEWSVDRLSKFLDRYPNTTVDLAARMAQVQYQSARNYAKVRKFFIKYQDRLLYGTDLTQNPDDDPKTFGPSADSFWRSDWLYLATGQTQRIDDLKARVRGLALPRPVIDKIYYANARKVFHLAG